MSTAANVRSQRDEGGIWSGRRSIRLPILGVLVAMVLALLPVPANAAQTAPPRPVRPEATDNDGPEIDPAILLERYGPLRFVVDPVLVPGTATIEPVDGTRDFRQVGAIAFPDGQSSEFVLDHVILHAASAAERDGFLARWGATVLESDEADSQGQLHMVKVDPSAADVEALPANLLAIEPEHVGEHRLSDLRALRLFALVAQEAAGGTTITLSWLAQGDTIASGQVLESPEVADEVDVNVFNWPYMRVGGPLDIGVARAWQLLQDAGRLDAKVRLLVNDGGFVPNQDSAEKWILSYTDAGEPNSKPCSSGNSCPWHGTSVTAAAMAEVDNGYGAAGPAGPLKADLIAVGNGSDVWTQFRRLARKVEEYHPKVVNMSWSYRTTVFKDAQEFSANRHLGNMNEAGALLIASAGNSGGNIDGDSLILPCESSRVLCVGGTNRDWTLGRDPASNYGTKDDTTSVEIYAPYCVLGITDPGDPDITQGIKKDCGTSFSAPFVAGVAALVIAANPSLTYQQVRVLLNDTAHTGLYGNAPTSGTDRWIDAAKAVATALHAAPKVEITAPADKSEHGVNSSFGFEATVVDYHGDALPVQWASSIDGKLSTPKTGVLAWPSLSVGKHKITATVVDALGQSATDHISIEVVDEKAEVWVVSPPKGESFNAGVGIELTGLSIDPDTGSSLPDNQVGWVIRRSGAKVHEAVGHEATLPGAKALAGNYVAEFSGDGSTASRTFSVASVPAGETAPTATITSPQQITNLVSFHGDPVHVALAGTGTDKEDGSLPGTRFQWVATDQFGTTKVLCTGSLVPKQGGAKDKLNIPQDCSSVNAELPWNPKAVTETKWSVRLKVFDSSGLPPGSDVVTVSVTFAAL